MSSLTPIRARQPSIPQGTGKGKGSGKRVSPIQKPIPIPLHEASLHWASLPDFGVNFMQFLLLQGASLNRGAGRGMVRWIW